MADTEPTPTGTPEPGTPPPTAEPQPDKEPGKTFTQEQVNDYVAVERKKLLAKYTDYSDLKAAADELAKIKESQLSETEKLTKRLAELEAAKQQAETRTRETLIRSAVISEAAKLNFNDPEDAYRLIDVTGLTIADSGKVEGAPEAVKLLAESRKYLLKNSNPALSSFNPAGGNEAVSETDAQKRARIYGSGGHIFDTGRAEQAGGGVVWPKGPAGE